MSETELEQAILDYILITYNAEYVGFIEVIKNETIYTLELGIPSYMTKTNIGGDFSSDEDFLDYIKNEIDKRNYMRVYFYKVNRTHEQTEE